MSRRPQFTDPWEAARVSTFMEPASHGRWKIHSFEIDEDDYVVHRLAIMHEHGDNEERRRLALDRQIPVGTYVSLKRRATEQELNAGTEDAAKLKLGDGYVPIMSDTPSEIEEHRHAIDNATGRVLIHGLGLGVLVSALLAKPEVTHIDVVEIDPDVIALTGPYYDDPRVSIHRGDCVTFAWPDDARWDYVWHDIWSHISARNLNDAEAEHGITYQAMFALFNDRSDMQGAWAYEEALWMEKVQAEERERNRAFNARFFAASKDERVEMIFDQVVREKLIGPDGRPALPEDVPIPAHIAEWFEAQGLRDAIAEGIERAEAEGRLTAEAYEAWIAEPDPIGHPNAELQEAP